MSSRSIRVCALAALALALLVPSWATAASPGASERMDSADAASPAQDAVSVLAAPLPGMTLAGSRVAVVDDSGTEVGSTTTNRLGTAEVHIGSAAGTGPWTVSVRGGTLRYVVEGEWVSRPFTGELQARASRIDAAAPVVIVDVVSTSALALVAQGRLPYARALDATQRALGIPVEAPAYTTAFLNWDVSGVKLLRAAEQRGGYEELIAAIVAAAARGGRLDGDLEPKRGRGAAQPDDAPSETARTQGSSAALQVRSTPPVANSCVGGTAGAGTANGTAPSGTGFDFGTVRGYDNYSPNLIRNMGREGTREFLRRSAGPVGEGLAPLVVGFLFGTGKPVERQLIETIIDNQQVMARHLAAIVTQQQAIATQLNCITTQLGQLDTRVDEIGRALGIAVPTAAAATCEAQIKTGWLQYQYLVKHASKDYPLDLTNNSVRTDARRWQDQLTACGSLIDSMLFGSNPQRRDEGTWAKVLQRQSDIAKAQQNGAITPPQLQELQTYLAYWGALQYQALVLVTEANSLFDAPQSTLALMGADENGQCPAAPASDTYCRFASNMRSAIPDELLSNELGYLTCPVPSGTQGGCAVSALPGGLGIVPEEPSPAATDTERALAMNDANLLASCTPSTPDVRQISRMRRLYTDTFVTRLQSVYTCTDDARLVGTSARAWILRNKTDPRYWTLDNRGGGKVSPGPWLEPPSKWYRVSPPRGLGRLINPAASFAENALSAARRSVARGSGASLPSAVATWKHPKVALSAVPYVRPTATQGALFDTFAVEFHQAAFASAGGGPPPKQMTYLPAAPVTVTPEGQRWFTDSDDLGNVFTYSDPFFFRPMGFHMVFPADCVEPLPPTLPESERPTKYTDDFFTERWLCTRAFGRLELYTGDWSPGIPEFTAGILALQHPRFPMAGVPPTHVVNCPGSKCPPGFTYSFLAQNPWSPPRPVANSITDSWTPPPATAPVAPEAPSLTASAGRIDVKWAPPWSNGRRRITGYTATAASGATCTTSSATSTECTIVGLANNTTHTVTVTATNAIGTSSASAPSSVAMPTPPSAPGAPLLTAYPGRIDVTWTAPEADGGGAITGYTATAASGATCTTNSATSTECTIVGLANNTTHTVTVTATNAIGTSIASAPSTVAMPTPPDAPGAPLLTAFPGRIDVAWTAPEADGGAAVTGYIATAQPGGATCTTTTDTTCTIADLKPDTTYTVTVAATNVVGTGLASEASTAVTPSAPIAVLQPETGSFGSDVTLAPQAVAPTGAVSPSGVLSITGFNLLPRTLVPGIGSNITYTLSEPAAVTITFTHSGDRARSSRVVYRIAQGRPGAVAGATKIRLLYDHASAARKRAGVWNVRIEARTPSGTVAARTLSVKVRTTAP